MSETYENCLIALDLLINEGERNGFHNYQEEIYYQEETIIYNEIIEPGSHSYNVQILFLDDDNELLKTFVELFKPKTYLNDEKKQLAISYLKKCQEYYLNKAIPKTLTRRKRLTNKEKEQRDKDRAIYSKCII